MECRSKEMSFEAIWSDKSLSIRRYPAAVIAEVVAAGADVPNQNDCSQILSEYVGFNGAPSNSEYKTMMMMPYLVVLDKAGDHEGLSNVSNPTVSFFLPPDFTEPSAAPEPADQRIQLRVVPSRLFAVRTVKARLTDKQVGAEVAIFLKELGEGSIVRVEEAKDTRCFLARYELGGRTTNEVWVQFPDKSKVAAAMIKLHEQRKKVEAAATDAANLAANSMNTVKATTTGDFDQNDEAATCCCWYCDCVCRVSCK